MLTLTKIRFFFLCEGQEGWSIQKYPHMVVSHSTNHFFDHLTCFFFFFRFFSLIHSEIFFYFQSTDETRSALKLFAKWIYTFTIFFFFFFYVVNCQKKLFPSSFFFPFSFMFFVHWSCIHNFCYVYMTERWQNRQRQLQWRLWRWWWWWWCWWWWWRYRRQWQRRDNDQHR